MLIVILSGCSVNYDLYLENNNFTEIMEIYEQTGITSYNYSVSSARIYMLYYILKDALIMWKINMVFFMKLICIQI